MPQGQLLTGNTYPVKEELKKLGARWDAANKGWRSAPGLVAQAREIIAKAPKQEQKNSGPRKYSSLGRAGWRPCGYPGCSPHYCDECDGKGM